MKIIRDYRCGTCNAVSEHWASAEEVASLECPSCGSSVLTPMIAAPHFGIIDSIASGVASSDGLTTAIDRWDKMRRQKLKIEQRNLERHGTVD